jgi:FtsP/CotA-like multicopper oxidase with cupredoxin domain
MIQIANDGNLLPRPVMLTQLDELGIAERYDIVIDFSRYAVGSKVWMVNVAAHADPALGVSGRNVVRDVSLAEALSGTSPDPCVGKFLEFRIVRNPAKPDLSQVPGSLIPNPDLSAIPVVRERVFEFGRDALQTGVNPVTSFTGPWGIATDAGPTLAADFGRVSAAPRFGTREVWTLTNGGGGWDHPIHIHFEEGILLARDGKTARVPAWERGRKDVYRLRPSGSVTISLQFRDFGGMFMEHCHNTTHEDNAMLLRWEVDDAGDASLRPLPTPIPTPQGVTFLTPDDILPTAY